MKWDNKDVMSIDDKKKEDSIIIDEILFLN